MSKKTNQSKRPTPTPAVVLFGIDEANKPHAAYFDEAHVELATKAAGLMGLNVLKVANHEQAKIACSLPAGRIYANGRGFVPYVRKDLYSKVTELAGTQATHQLRGPQSIASTEGPSSGSSVERQPANPAGRRAGPGLPRHWDDIDVGHLVIAPEDNRKDDGWWQAIVVEKNGDMFTLRWQAFPHQKKILRHRLNIGLMYPGADDRGSLTQPTAASSSATSSPEYPKTWDDIAADSLVLAKEEGPMEAWWDAIVIEQNGDAFTLRWRDYPHLPAIVRHRLNLSLLNPNPH
jgi:hypothetical protein